MNNQLTVAWFSAVATKLVADSVDRIIYTHIEDQHPDTIRFVIDCQEWFGRPVEILQSPIKTVEAACLSAGGRGYIRGPAGAACTKTLKREVRKRWEYELPLGTELTYVWGMDADEADRMEQLHTTVPHATHRCPLIEQGISKQTAHQMLSASGIQRPAMYDLGYVNNNCVGCLKGGMAYWNKIRVDFPGVFKSRAELERKVGATCLKEKNGARIWLDELDPTRGRGQKPIVGECGIMCEVLGWVS